MHRTLMSAFPTGLSSHGAARAEAGLLYRVEAGAGGTIGLLIQSVLPPDWAHLPPSWLHPDAEPQVKEITEALGRVDSGSLLRFKLVANKSDLANFRIFFHQVFLSFLAARASYAPTEPDLGTPRLQLG